TDDPVVRAMASEVEVLRHRDVASLSAAEKSRLSTLFGTLHPRPPRRRTSRHQRWHRGTVDASRTLRASLRRMGEPADIEWRRRGNKPRRVVLLIDVSGSMSGQKIAKARKALSRFINTSHPNDEYFLIAFNNRAQLLLDRSRDVHRRHPAHPDHPRATLQGS
ncbi:MAG TPA: VWA domain-containing protein, partial [Nocardioides sp.]|nr:VWA domain-containing protein [Nocardioides sp.]